MVDNELKCIDSLSMSVTIEYPSSQTLYHHAVDEGILQQFFCLFAAYVIEMSYVNALAFLSFVPLLG